jgi:hypothetical protein
VDTDRLLWTAAVEADEMRPSSPGVGVAAFDENRRGSSPGRAVWFESRVHAELVVGAPVLLWLSLLDLQDEAVYNSNRIKN